MNLRSRAVCGGWRGASPALLLLALAAPGALPARAGAVSPIVAEASSAAKGTRSESKGAARRRLGPSALDRRIALLAKALDLDASQQTALRKLLLDQREQVRRIWSDESLASADRIALTKAVSKQTADRIRALLKPEQRKKYDPPPQAGPAQAVADAHVEDWMQGGKRSGELSPSPPPAPGTVQRSEGVR